MHVKTNQLGPIEKLINRQGWTNRKTVLAAFVLALDSAVIWNVPAVHCTQKTAAFPKPDPGIALSGNEAQAPGPWGTAEGPWEETDGQEWRCIATGWHSH